VTSFFAEFHLACEIDSSAILRVYIRFGQLEASSQKMFRNFLMEPIRDIVCLRASTILSFESPFMLPHCSRKRDVCYKPLSFAVNFGVSENQSRIQFASFCKLAYWILFWHFAILDENCVSKPKMVIQLDLSRNQIKSTIAMK